MRKSVFGNRADRRDAMRNWRVTLNGADVTNDCQEADDRRGVALLIDRDETGSAYLLADKSGPSRRWHRGVVRLTRKKAA